MMDSLATTEAFTVKQEEGQQTAPLAGDAGGDTNWGVTLARLSEWRGVACTAAELYALSYEEACCIFRAGYWNALRCWAQWPGLDLMVADHGFNRGTGPSARVLQTLLRVRVDGHIGTITSAAARAVNDKAGFLLRLRDAQDADYRRLDAFARFGPEWVGDPAGADDWHRLGRLGRRHAAALALAGLAPV